MLGTIGFSIAAAAFFAYGLTSSKLGTQKDEFPLENYALAYYLTAIACLFWAVGTKVDSEILMSFVLIGDAFILIASLLLLRIISPKKYVNTATLLATVIAIGALFYRGNANLPKAIMRNNVLVFNTPRLFGALITFILLLVWLKANMKFYEHIVAKKSLFNTLQTNYYATNIVGLIGVSGFLFARKYLTIVVSFTMLIVAFATLTALNMVALSYTKKADPHAK